MKKSFLTFFLLLAHCLVAISQSDLEIDTIIDRVIYKSFYSLKYCTPVYVQYKLYRGGGHAKRDGQTFYQSLACPMYQYAGSGYDRGHLCPAADMAMSTSTMRLTFDFVNILPQVPALNRGEWKRDEIKVRRLSQNDSLFIECGGMKFDTLTHHVPEMFYKIVVSLSTGDTIMNKRYFNR